MPTVTSENKAKFDREFMEKKGLIKKPKEDSHEHLRQSGFKELTKDYEWAKAHELEDKTKHSFNVKHAGTPPKYHVRRSVSKPGLSAAAVKMGEYESPHQVTQAIDEYMNERKKRWRSRNFVVKTAKPYQLGQLGEFFEETQCQK